MSQKDLLAFLLLVLGVVTGVQVARYHVQVDGVEKTVRSLVPEFHQRGLEAYRTRLLHELGRAGLVLGLDDLELEENLSQDELRVVLHYSWPLEVLLWQLPRDHVYELSVPLYDL